jgi:NADH-quinone oxidoreductase subunit N
MNTTNAILSIVIPTINYGPLLPVILVTITGLVALILDALLPRDGQTPIAWVAIAGLAIAFLVCIFLFNGKQTAFGGTFVADNFALYFDFVLLFAAALTILLSVRFPSTETLNSGDYYALLLFGTAGMLLVAQAADLVLLFIGIETLSIALYVLAGYTRSKAVSEEAALKYFLMGAFAFGFLLYGTALLYGATGSTTYANIAGALGPNATSTTMHLATIGMGMLLVGFGFKLAFVPFHQWTPDVYDGAPTPVTAFMSVATKVAVFAGLLRVLDSALAPITPQWFSVLWALAVLTMIVGNLVAVVQSNIKRMLAYSSIAQAGYVLVGTIAGGTDGQSATMFYLLVYTLMNLGAFAVVAALAQRGEEALDIRDYSGLANRQPALAALMALFMLSLAGLPLTAGFIGKLYLFVAALESGHAELVVIGVLTSAVSAFYYLRLIVLMYFRPAPEGAPALPRIGISVGTLLGIAAVGTLLFGIVPSLILGLAQGSIGIASLP